MMGVEPLMQPPGALECGLFYLTLIHGYYDVRLSDWLDQFQLINSNETKAVTFLLILDQRSTNAAPRLNVTSQPACAPKKLTSW